MPTCTDPRIYGCTHALMEASVQAHGFYPCMRLIPRAASSLHRFEHASLGFASVPLPNILHYAKTTATIT